MTVFCFVHVKTLKDIIKFFKIVVSALGILLGSTFFIFSIPVYILRVLVSLLAKVLRPDLDGILNGQSSMFLCDYMADTPPRSNIIITNTFQNQLLHEDLKTLVMTRIIKKFDGNTKRRNPYRKFQQYPVHWLGFPFWKNAAQSFCIDNHVQKLVGKETIVFSEQLTEIMEKLLNSLHPRMQSPWAFFVVENYKETPNSPSQSVAIFKVHHTLADGFGLFSALIKGLFEDNSEQKLDSSKAKFSSGSYLQSVSHFMTLPLNMLIDGSVLLSNLFTSNPLKIPDDKKKWHQNIARTGPIPIQTIKDIKNACGVSFTSVLMSAVSAAINKSLKENDKTHWQEPIPCFRVLPMENRYRIETVTNSVTGSVINLPTKNYQTPLKRLLAVEKKQNGTKHAVHRYVAQYYTSLVGQHFFSVCKLLCKNKVVPIAITNFPGLSRTIELNGNPYVGCSFALGGFSGDTGVIVSVISHNQEIRIVVVVESGIMSKEQTTRFAKYIKDEILLLSNLTHKSGNILK